MRRFCFFMARLLPCQVLGLRYFYIFFTRFRSLFFLVLCWFAGLISRALFLQLKDLVEACGLEINCFDCRFEKYSFAFAVSLDTFRCLCLYDFEDRFWKDLTLDLFHLLFNLFFNHFLLIGKTLLILIHHEKEDDLNFQVKFECFL